jgi:hypothetical protein
MTFTVLGKVPVPTAGTPVPLSTDKTLIAVKIVVSQVPGTSGVTYLKNIKTGVALIARAFLPPGASGFTDEHLLEADDESDLLYPADWAIDAAVNGEGLNVYWVTI